MNHNIHVFDSNVELVKAAAEKIVEIVTLAITERSRCSVALAGGSTPRDVYALLATENYRSRVEWENVFLFWGDERCVPPEHPDSNFRMVKESLLANINIPPLNIFRIRGEIEPAAAAEEYEFILNDFFKNAAPRFDLILLGLGDDGHTASLFPGTNALDETQRWAISIFVPKFNSYRMTLTLPVINNARHVVFIVSGKSKSQIIPRVINSEEQIKELPATFVRPLNGQLDWLLDAEAASLL